MSNSSNIDVGGLVRLLKELAEIAEQASLTGALEGGTVRAVKRYNSVLRLLEEADKIPRDLFQPLDEDCEYDELAVETKLLIAHLNGSSSKEKEKDQDRPDRSLLIRLAPFVKSEDLAAMIREYRSKTSTHLDANTITHLAPFLDSGFLGEIVKEDILKMFQTEEKAKVAEPVVAPPPAPVAEEIQAPPIPEPVKEQIPEPEKPRDAIETLYELSRQLCRADLSYEERNRIAGRLAELAEHQAGGR